jgi:hypothetical protein
MYVCRFFGADWVEISYKSEWSKSKKTAGGCINYDTVGQNPQLKMLVQGNEPVEMYGLLEVETPIGVDQYTVPMGFQIYDLKG